MRNSDKEIVVKIKTLNSTTFPINIHKKSLISELKRVIFQKVRIHSNNQKLIYQGKVLENDKTISDYKIEEYDVIHLVETDSRNYRSPPSSNINTNSNNNNDTTGLGEYERLINSIFPSFDDILNSLRSPNTNNNNNNNSNSNNNINTSSNNNINSINDVTNNNNSNNTEGIYDSFKHLLKYKTYNFVKSGEVLTQNIDNLYNMYNNLIDLNLEKSKKIKRLYCLNTNTKFKVGQWIDVKDHSDKWVEGQIISVKDDKIKVQFIGSNTNEWLNTISDRVALFRTNTLQDNLKNFYSLYPNKNQEFNRDQIHVGENENMFYTGIKKFEPLNNHLIIFMDLLKEKIKKILKIKEKINIKDSLPKDEFLDNERYFYLSCIQLYPLLDRLGRIFIDIANYLMYDSYRYFENNIYNFRKNVFDESLRFMNVYDSLETVNKNRLKHFQTLSLFSCAKINKDENITNINNNTNTTNDNNRRPIYGIILTRPRELNRQDYINRSRRYMVARENISIIANKKEIERKRYFNEYVQTEEEGFKKLSIVKKNINILFKASYDKNIINSKKETLKESKAVAINNSEVKNDLRRSNNLNVSRKERIIIEARDKEVNKNIEMNKAINIKNSNNLNKIIKNSNKNEYSSISKSNDRGFRINKSKGKTFIKK